LAIPTSINTRTCALLLAGSAGGQIKTGRHIAYPENTPMTNLPVSLLDKVGVRTEDSATVLVRSSICRMCSGGRSAGIFLSTQGLSSVDVRALSMTCM